MISTPFKINLTCNKIQNIIYGHSLRLLLFLMLPLLCYSENNTANGVSILLLINFRVYYCLYWHLTRGCPLWGRKKMFFKHGVIRGQLLWNRNCFSNLYLLFETLWLEKGNCVLRNGNKQKQPNNKQHGQYYCLCTSGFIIAFTDTSQARQWKHPKTAKKHNFDSN